MSSASPHWRAGARAVSPILLGIIPFGLVAGAAPGAAGLGTGFALAYSPIVFAGAAQLAMVDLLGGGAGLGVVVGTALVINLRMLMYGASLAPQLAPVPLGARLGAAYLLTDQAYAVTISRYGVEGAGAPWRERFAYYMGAGVLLWITWQVTSIVGIAIGGQIPDDVPLEFVIPLVFLAMLLPAVYDRPTLVAAVVGGGGAVAYAEMGAGHLSLLAGALTGVAAGAGAAWWQERVTEPDEGRGS